MLLNMFAEFHARQVRKNIPQQRFAMFQRGPAKIVTIQVEKIKDVVGNLAAKARIVLKSFKVSLALFV